MPECSTIVWPFNRTVLTAPAAYVYSDGRREITELLGRILLSHNFTSPIQSVFQQSPVVPISDDALSVFRSLPYYPSDIRVVTDWLRRTVEGRPEAGDWLYSASKPIGIFAEDVLRIAALKLRPLFLELVAAHKQGIGELTRLVCARDTGQVIKLAGRDILRYQSHPGPDGLAQVLQAKELQANDYALLVTSVIFVAGHFNTSSVDELYRIASSLFGIANSHVLQPNQMPQQSSMMIIPKVYCTFFRVGDDYLFRDEEHAYRNVPGGLTIEHPLVKQSMSYLDYENVSVFELTPSLAGFSPNNFVSRGTWKGWDQASAMDCYEDFEVVRRGFIPVGPANEIIEHIVGFLKKQDASGIHGVT